MDKPERKTGEKEQTMSANQLQIISKTGKTVSSIELFLANLGQLLEFLNRQEKKGNENSKHTAIIDTALDSRNAVDLEKKRKKEASIGDGGDAVFSKPRQMTELDIIQAIPTLRWDKGKWYNVDPKEPPQEQMKSLSNTEPNKEAIRVRVSWEEEETSPLFRVRSLSDLASLHPDQIEFEDEEDGGDRWTENSYGEEEDVFDKFLDKMENCRSSSKQNQNIEALVSPKANEWTGRKLRARNPRVCYSEGKYWNQRFS